MAHCHRSRGSVAPLVRLLPFHEDSVRILLTGGTGVVGPATVSELVVRGHTIRLLSRHAVKESRQWPAGVEALDVAGPELTSMNDLIERVRDITGRTPLTVPITGAMTVAGAKLASAIGVDVPIDQGQIMMLEEGNLIEKAGDNALTSELGIEPTSLTDGLKLLAHSLPEQLPDKGIGALRRKQVWVDIRGSKLGAEQLFERFRQRFSDVSPWSMNVGSEPGTPTEPSEGATLTMSIPLRGNVQVRVEELTPRSMTLVTLEGHPLAGAVRFLSEERGDCIRFEVQVYDRAADVADWLMMHSVGEMIQMGTWKSLVQRVAEESGGDVVGGVHTGVHTSVHTEVESLDDDEADRIREWLRELVVERKRDEAGVAGGVG